MAAPATEVYRQLTGRKQAAGLRGRADPGDLNRKVLVPTPTTTRGPLHFTYQEPSAASPLNLRDCGSRSG